MHACLYLFFDLVVIHHVLYCSYSNSFMNYYNIPSNPIKQTKTASGTWASHDELKQVKPLKMIKEILLEILSTFSLSPIDNFNRRNSTFSPIFHVIEIPEIKYDKFLSVLRHSSQEIIPFIYAVIIMNLFLTLLINVMINCDKS